MTPTNDDIARQDLKVSKQAAELSAEAAKEAAAAHNSAVKDKINDIKDSATEKLSGLGEKAKGMAAEALEILRAGAQSVIQVEAAEAAARALAALAVAADHDRRQVKLLTQARGGDADHALMPRVAREHERLSLIHI